MNRYENDGVTRYEVQLDQGLPIVGEIVPKYHPTYDNLKNDNIKKRRRVIFFDWEYFFTLIKLGVT